jgi:hypothetical protein
MNQCKMLSITSSTHTFGQNTPISHLQGSPDTVLIYMVIPALVKYQYRKCLPTTITRAGDHILSHHSPFPFRTISSDTEQQFWEPNIIPAPFNDTKSRNKNFCLAAMVHIVQTLPLAAIAGYLALRPRSTLQEELDLTMVTLQCCPPIGQN